MMNLSNQTRAWAGSLFVTATLALSACGGGGDATTSGQVTTDASELARGLGKGGKTPTPTPAPAPAPTPTPTPITGTVSTEVYTITVYYTAVESFHTDAKINVSGCLIRDCAFGTNLIGSYPATFIKATKTEGTGRITSGANAGKYLNWSSNVGYWLDTIPSDGYGTALVPFRTAAADDIALTRGTKFALVAPLIQDDGTPLDSTSANKLLSAQWLINDQFTPGLGGALHLDLYIGEEDRVNFTNQSPMYLTLMNTKIIK
jgi:hypothetical protein